MAKWEKKFNPLFGLYDILDGERTVAMAMFEKDADSIVSASEALKQAEALLRDAEVLLDNAEPLLILSPESRQEWHEDHAAWLAALSRIAEARS